MMKTICATGCNSYVGSILIEALKLKYDVRCITHQKTQLTEQACDVLIHIGWLCDNESLKHLKNHISNIRYSLRLLKYIKARYTIFFSSFGAKFSNIQKDITNAGQFMYNITKRFIEILFRYVTHNCLVIRLPYVFDHNYLKPHSLAYKMIHSNIILDKPLPFVHRQTLIEFIDFCLHNSRQLTGVVEIVDLYATHRDELLEFSQNHSKNWRLKHL